MRHFLLKVLTNGKSLSLSNERVSRPVILFDAGVVEVLDFPSSRNSLVIFSQCQVLMISLTISLTVFLTSASLGSAVMVERIFSGGHDTISLQRASLKPETIRILMLVKQKLHLACNAAQQALGDT